MKVKRIDCMNYAEVAYPMQGDTFYMHALVTYDECICPSIEADSNINLLMSFDSIGTYYFRYYAPYTKDSIIITQDSVVVY